MFRRGILTILKIPPFQSEFSKVKYSMLNCPARLFRNFSSQDNSNRKLVPLDPFLEIANKNKETFVEMLDIYKKRDIHRRNHVEFIYCALKYMKEFGVEKDLEVYRSIIDILPKEKMVPRNVIQAEFMHYPKQQQCAIDLLEQMEENAVIPDWKMEGQLLSIFGRRGYPLRRYWRMMYWFPKFKNASPWPLPNPVPSDSFQLSRLAIERICSIDPTTKINIFKTSQVEGSLDDTWIISGQSLEQRDLLADIPDKTSVFVEGGFRIWLRNKCVTYFILRVDPYRDIIDEIDTDDISNLAIPIFSKEGNEMAKRRRRSVHEQSDGVILGVCATGTSAKDSLLSWVRLLEKNGNPHLAKLMVLFPRESPIGKVSSFEKSEDN